MVQNRRAWVDNKGTARLTFLYCVYLMKMIWSSPKVKHDKSEIPVDRLMMLASFTKKQQQNLLPKRWQWILFVVSSLLFALLGSFFWDLSFVLVIFAIIFLHEGGHYLAMRVSGYRNVQMLALPLLGGVTIGIEEKPSATKRAWIAMMGPLPGILLVWSIFLGAVLINSNDLLDIMRGWLLMPITLLLLINYLNLLPMLPFDGGHIVQAILPPRWTMVRVIFIIITSLIGIIASWIFSLYAVADRVPRVYPWVNEPDDDTSVICNA